MGCLYMGWGVGYRALLDSREHLAFSLRFPTSKCDWIAHTTPFEKPFGMAALASTLVILLPLCDIGGERITCLEAFFCI